LLLGSALLPAGASADDTPPVPAEAPPLPSAPATAAKPPVRPALPSNAAIDRTKSYYLFFEQTIDFNTMKALRKELATVVEAGVTDVTLVLSSSGGQLFAALNAYSFIRALPATINTHATGLVASAATVLFLAGEQRSSDRNTLFVFHPSQSAVPGMVNEQQMHEQISVMDDVAAAVAQIYRERTKLSDAEIQRMQQETVTLDAAKARDLDIVGEVADLRIPGGQKAKIVFVE
jgi:ATP-dependent protease ClpP protease subunit